MDQSHQDRSCLNPVLGRAQARVLCDLNPHTMVPSSQALHPWSYLPNTIHVLSAQYLYFYSIQKISFLHEVIEEPLSLDECCWCVEFSDFAMVQHNDSVGVKNCVDPVGNGYDRSVLENAAPKSGLHSCIGLNIYCGLFQDQMRTKIATRRRRRSCLHHRQVNYL